MAGIRQGQTRGLAEPDKLSRMTANSTKRDVLTEVFHDRDEDSTPALDALQALVYRPPQRAVERSADAGTAVPGPVKTGAKPLLLSSLFKKKTTVYLSEESHAELSKAVGLIKNVVGPENDAKVSMSSIIDHALKIVLKDLELKRESSVLLKRILRDMPR